MRFLSSFFHVFVPFSSGEHILLCLVRTVGRQLHEQRQYRPSRASKKAADKDGNQNDSVGTVRFLPYFIFSGFFNFAPFFLILFVIFRS